MSSYVGEVKMLTQVDSQAHTLLEMVPNWRKALAAGLVGGRPFSQTTIYTYTLYVTQFIKSYGEVTTKALKQAMLDIPVIQYGKRSKYHQAVLCFARYLQEEGYKVEKGFSIKAKSYRPKRHIPPNKITVNEAGLTSLLEACKNELDRLIIILLSQTGLRASEAAGLELKDINFEDQFLTVKLAKWGKTRRVGLTPTVIEAINAYLIVRPTQAIDTQRLMVNDYNRPITRHGLHSRVEKLSNKAGVPATPHALRRAFVTINANKGRPLPMLQIACGHNNITTTRSYCLTSEDETIDAMKTWV